MNRTRNILRLLVLTGALFFIAIPSAVNPSQIAFAAPTVSVTNPTSLTSLIEDQDYASHEWHDPWDMNEESDLYFFLSPTCNNQTLQYQTSSFSGGIWSATYKSGTPDPAVWLVFPGYHNSLHVGKDGFVHSINATVYTQLTFRMFLGVGAGFLTDSTPGGKLLWTNSDTLGICDASVCGISKFFQVFPGWNIYTIDLTQIGTQNGGLNWGGSVTGIELYTGYNSGGTGTITDVKIDWVRITPKPSHTVAWSGSWQALASSKAELSFSADNSTFETLRVYTNNDVFNNNIVHVDSIPAGNNGSTGSFAVPSSFPAGNEYVKVKVTDGTGSTTSNPGAGPWQFSARPDITFVAPSYTSGDDFATKVVGNPWDMSDSADISSWDQMTGSPTFSNGILTATSTNAPPNCGLPWGDPKLFLNMNGQSVNPSYYRFFTVKIKIDSPFDFGNGWVSRLYWILNDYNNYGGSNDMPLYQTAGNSYWNVFNVDMWGNVQDESAPGNRAWNTISPNILRFDPHEIPPSTQFEIDYIKLTATDNAKTGTIFPIKYLLNLGYNATFCYDLDRNPGGCTTALQAGGGPRPSGTYSVFLPLLIKGFASSDPPGTRIFNWNLAGVSPGTYYIGAIINDGENTMWYSETPVVINP